MQTLSLEMPKKVEVDEETLTDLYGKFVVEPLQKGYGVTVGNALRRVLFSSIQGTAITSVKIEGAMHEFTTIPGVVEDVTDLILNLKEIRIKLLTDGPKTIYLSVEGEKEVLASDIKSDSDVEVLTPDVHIATLNREGKLSIEMELDKGVGYVPAEKNKREDQPIGVIPIDVIFSPVKKVRYDVEAANVRGKDESDKLTVEIWTDGQIKPSDAMTQAARILKGYLDPFQFLGTEPPAEMSKKDDVMEKLKDILNRSVEELELSVRSCNCLKNANIHTIGELVQKSEGEMLKYRNFGRKSLNEIKEILYEMGLSLGMKLDSLDVSFPRIQLSSKKGGTKKG